MNREDAIEAAPEQGPLKILLVEDSRTDAKLLMDELRSASLNDRVTITHVLTRNVAVDQVSTQHFDCVLLDLGLPDGDGVENIARIRKASRAVTIVVMTGMDNEARALEALRMGAQEYLIKGQLKAEPLLRHIRHAIQRHALMSDLEAQHERHKLLSGHDVLTGLANRSLLADRAREAISQAARRAERLSICFLDLDGFKAVNDRLGHAAGDAALVEVTKRLRSAVRTGDSIARVGGDEFVVLQFPIGTDDDVRESGARLVSAVKDIGEVQGEAVTLGASVGIAIYPDHGSTLEELLLHADEVMYGVKRSGGCGVNIKSHRPRRRFSDREGGYVRPEIGNAALVYQPWLTAQGETGGVEALLRHRRGPVWTSPEQLLAAAECLGPLSGLTEWVLRTACAQWGRWHRAGAVTGRLAVNMSANEVGLPGFPAIVHVALERESLPPAALQIELAEQLMEDPSDALLANMAALRERGVRIVLDRFGQQGGSLRKLVGLPIDGVKIDASVVASTAQGNLEQWALMAGTVHTAGLRGLDVVAVGVEGESEALGCLRVACTALQGHWIAAPVAANDVPSLLADPLRRSRYLDLRDASSGKQQS